MKSSRHVIRALFLLGLWLGLGLQAHAQTDTVTYVYTDPQGTPLVKADASGNVIARYDYTPYGNAVASLGNPPNGPGYTGHVNDPETGLVYMQQRYYQPIGRFLSPDPVDPSAGNLFNFNRYSYANNNPIANTDPTGRCSPTDGFPCYEEGSDDPYAGHFYAQDHIKDEITQGQESDRKAIAAAKPYVEGGLSLIPGVGLVQCAAEGCSGRDWALSAIAVIPVEGDLATAAKALEKTLPAALSGGEASVHVYQGVKDSEAVYAGITNNLVARQAAHGERFTLAPLTTSPVTRGEARAIEQALIVRNPGFQNVRNSISPRHSYYQKSVDWGEQWLKANGH